MHTATVKDFTITVAKTLADNAEALVALSEEAKENELVSRTPSEAKVWLNLSEELRELSVTTVEESLKYMNKKILFQL